MAEVNKSKAGNEKYLRMIGAFLAQSVWTIAMGFIVMHGWNYGIHRAVTWANEIDWLGGCAVCVLLLTYRRAYGQLSDKGAVS